MSMQIKAIHLYHRDGRTRNLEFRPGMVNVITGKSSTGKSSISDIIEYCLGRSEFRVPAGRIRDTVACYAVTYQLSKSQIFIAKFPPAAGEARNSAVYFQIAASVTPPPLREIQPNSTDDAVVEHMSGILGIGTNTTAPGKDQTRLPYEASIKHARLFLFQRQGVVANQEVLFHRQSEPFMPQTIKDTLPFFLGAVRRDFVHLNQELRNARRDLKIAERQLEEAERISSEGRTTGLGLIAEAKEVGLLQNASSPANQKEVIENLKQCLNWKATDLPKFNDSRLPQLEAKMAAARKSFEETQSKINGLEIFLSEGAAFTRETKEQERRLASINIFQGTTDTGPQCPLCASTPAIHPPALSAIAKSLARVRHNLDTVAGEQPRIQKFINSLISDREKTREKIRELETEVAAILANRSEVTSVLERNARIAIVLGKITLYLESASQSQELSPLRTKVKEKQRRVEQIEKQLDPEKMQDKLAAILSEIGLDMTRWAEELKLEHRGHPYRLDINKLTVVADRHGNPIPMGAAMGGGENWLGCHLIAHLALHSYFVREGCPMPNFLILDQPTQVYFPPEKFDKVDGKTSQIKDEDRIAVERMFKLLFSVCKALSPNFQIIVLDHANLETPVFQSALVEEPWRGGKALIPQDW